MKKGKIKILVSGSSGQLGSELKRLAKNDSGTKFYFKSSQDLNLRSKRSITNNLANSDFDYFINAGAYTAVDKAESDQVAAYEINAQALKTIAEVTPAKTQIIHISTDYVYDLALERPLLESDLNQPRSIYAKSKLQGEIELLKRRPDSIVIRTSWLYSVFGNNFVKTMLKLGKSRPDLTIVNDQHGSPTNCLDLAMAIMTIIKFLEEKNKRLALGGIYNYSNLGLTNWLDFANEIFVKSKISCRLASTTTAEYNAPAPRPLWSLLSKEKIQRTFHIQIADWKKSLHTCLRELGY